MKDAVLIVDDNTDVRTLIAFHLELAGMMVLQAVDGLDALNHLSAEAPPAVIILDWMMPMMEGPEVARRIREMGNKESYVIMLTAKGESGDQITGLRTGVDLYLIKPFDPEVLTAQVQLGMEQARRRQQAVEDHRQAILDKLTGLGNRRAFDETLHAEIARAHRSNLSFSMLMMDLDHFKAVNDTYGHQTGDAVLADLGQILRSRSRTSDRAFRYGGEEFSVLMPDTDAQGAYTFAEKLRAAVEGHEFQLVGRKTASFGVAVLAPDETPESLTSRADEALYRSKQEGRNRVTLHQILM